MPVVGILNSASPEAFPDRMRAFHRGLKDAGFVEGENVAIVYRWGENQFDRLPELSSWIGTMGKAPATCLRYVATSSTASSRNRKSGMALTKKGS